MVVVLGHQGGWDEALFVLAPLILFAVMLWVARRRVDRLDEDENRSRAGDDDAHDRT
jgi:cyanate permease